MMQKWPELTGTAEELDIQLLYRMLHVDRLRGVVPGGLAELIDPADEDADQAPFGVVNELASNEVLVSNFINAEILTRGPEQALVSNFNSLLGFSR
jgi:hypothetical protein